jgi:hypothetical protein
MDSGEICGGDANAIAITLAAVYEGTLELALLDPTGVDAEQATIQAVGFIFDGISA